MTYNINRNASVTTTKTTSFKPNYDYCHNYSLSISCTHFMYSLKWLKNKTINKRHMKKGDNGSERKRVKTRWEVTTTNPFTTLKVVRWRCFLIDCCIGRKFNPYVLNEFFADSFRFCNEYSMAWKEEKKKQSYNWNEDKQAFIQSEKIRNTHANNDDAECIYVTHRQSAIVNNITEPTVGRLVLIFCLSWLYTVYCWLHSCIIMRIT